ncbi:hypothetical protein M569_11167 [Genlisea aurea]|uniref:Late embryogenesis abundant protein LEA-2 subgroup domain-containing protein n=1 Tax=Genlisea aurea TaxID=192259 RepID=S8DL84_9LAMI|nr:hypothetical protein M569_11167 [Genlisea aurea]
MEEKSTADEDTQRHPLEPPGTGRIADQLTPFRSPGKRPSKLPVYALTLFVLLCAAFLIFGIVSVKLITPTLRLTSVAVHPLAAASVSLNATLQINVTLKNANYWAFDVGSVDGIFFYGGATIGKATFSGGGVVVKALGKTALGGAVELTYDGGGSFGTGDVMGGSISLWSSWTLTGRFNVVRFMSPKRYSVTVCVMDFNLTAQTIRVSSCD